MKVSASPRYLAPVLGFLLGGGCAGGQPPAPPASLDARVSRIFPKPKDLDTSVLAVKLEVYNPRQEPIPVQAVRYTLDTGEVAGKIAGTVDAGATLAAEQQAELGFDIDIPLPKDRDRIEALLAQEVVPADLSGTVLFGDGSTAAFDRKAGLAMPRLPRVVVFDAQAAQYENKGVDVTFFLRLLNENPFTMTVQAVTYSVDVGGKEMRAEQAGVGSRLTAGAAEEYEVSIQLDERSYEGLAALLASGEINYRVYGEVRTRDLSIPFDHPGTIALASTAE